MRICDALVIVAAIAGALPASALADEVPLGNWNGFAIRLNRENNNRPPRILVVKKVPDPHVAWRGGSGELTTVSFGQNQNNLRELSAISLSNGRLTFSYQNPDTQSAVTCVLLYQPKENHYVGDCIGDGDWRVTLNPPPPAAAKPAAPTPAEAK